MSEARVKALASKQRYGSQLLFHVKVAPQSKAAPCAIKGAPQRYIRGARSGGSDSHIPTFPTSPIMKAPLPPPTASSRLPTELISMIIDYIAKPRNYDPEFPWCWVDNVRSCCLVSRAWLPRSSKHLLGRMRFGPKDRVETVEEGERVAARLRGFLEYAKEHSQRIRSTVTGVCVYWCPGMNIPLDLELHRLIFSALPNLALIRFHGAPSLPNPMVELPRAEILCQTDVLELMYSEHAPSTQAWLFGHLRLFQRADRLNIHYAKEILDSTPIPQSQHLYAESLKVDDSGLAILRALTKILTPSSVSALNISYMQEWGDDLQGIRALNDFLESRRNILKTFVLFVPSPRKKLDSHDEELARLHALVHCTQLDLVEVRWWNSAWSIDKIIHDVLSCLPPTTPRIRIHIRMRASPYLASLEDHMEWSTLAEGLLRFTALRAVEVQLQCNALVFWGGAGPTGHLSPREQQAIHLQDIANILQSNQQRMRLCLAEEHKAVTSLTMEYTMEHALIYENIMREVWYRVDCETIRQLSDWSID